jgi:hypothetical protein
MRKDQGKAGLRVIRKREGGGAPAIDGMTALASATVGALEKLPCVGIRFMAISAGVVGYRSLEVSTLVASEAWDIEMFAEQRKVGLRVVEARCKGGLHPGGCVVAGLAPLLECAFMRIFMAVRTVGEIDSCVAGLAVEACGVALSALNVTVFTSKWEASLGMVEVLAINTRCLPVCCRMAACAVGSESPLVLVLVAGDAVWHQAEPCNVQLFTREQRARWRGNMLCGVAGTTAHTYMFAVEGEASCCVVKPFRGGVPVDHLEL